MSNVKYLGLTANKLAKIASKLDVEKDALCARIDELCVELNRARGTCYMVYDLEHSHDELYPTEAYICSACMFITVEGKPNYCPNCGRKVCD